MNRSYYQNVRPEERRVRMFRTENNDAFSQINQLRRSGRDLDLGPDRMQPPKPLPLIRSNVEAAIFRHLEKDGTPLCNIIESMRHYMKLETPDVAFIGEVVFDLYQRGIIEISGIVVNHSSPRDLDICIRRVPEKSEGRNS